MSAIRTTQILLAATAMTCIAWGYGTNWFILGMIALVAYFTLDGLARALRNDPTTWAPHEICGPIAEPWWVQDEADEVPYVPVDHKPVWDTEVMGAPE